MFLTQPLLWENNNYWNVFDGTQGWAKKKTRFKISAATYAKFQDHFNQKLLEICKKYQVSVFDLASKIPHTQLFFYDNIHYTEKGAELISNSVYEFMKDNFKQYKTN